MSATLWGTMIEEAASHERVAAMLRDQADRLRCDAEESGGQRCTGDKFKPHQHRIEEGDRPQ
jgi:hypothetical protein